jgi:hypothetical protein
VGDLVVCLLAAVSLAPLLRGPPIVWVKKKIWALIKNSSYLPVKATYTARGIRGAIVDQEGLVNEI